MRLSISLLAGLFCGLALESSSNRTGLSRANILLQSRTRLEAQDDKVFVHVNRGADATVGPVVAVVAADHKAATQRHEGHKRNSSAVTTGKPVFDYTFGANCPYCRDFGPTLDKVYNAAGIADSVQFVFRSAIRTSGDAYQCPDENEGCDYTQWVECAINGKSVSAKNFQKIAFISCWDESVEPIHSRAQTCSVDAGLSWDAVNTCHSGSEVQSLLKAASANFAAKWPEYTDPSGPYHVPHVLANDVNPTPVDRDSPTYDNIIKELCGSGAAGGACGSFKDQSFMQAQRHALQSRAKALC